MPTVFPAFDVTCGGGRTVPGPSWTNIGTGPMTFRVVASDNRFYVDPVAGTTMPEQTTHIIVTGYAPTDSSSAGVPITATLTVTSNLPDSPHLIQVSTIPIGGHVTIEPPSLAFGTVVVPQSEERIAMVRNDGNWDVSVRIERYPYPAPFTGAFGSSGTVVIPENSTAPVSFLFGGSNAALGTHETSTVVTVSGPRLCGVQPTALGLSGTGVSQ